MYDHNDTVLEGLIIYSENLAELLARVSTASISSHRSATGRPALESAAQIHRYVI